MSTPKCLKCLGACSCVVKTELADNGAAILSTSSVTPIIISNSLILKDQNSMNSIYFIRRESASSTQSNSGSNSLNSSDSGEKNGPQISNESNIQAINENPSNFIKIISISHNVGINQISNRTQFTIIKSNPINLNTIDINNKENSLNVIPIKVDRILPKPECTLDRLLTPTGSTNETGSSDLKTKKRTDLTFKCSRCSEKYETLNQLNTHEVIHVFDSGIMKSTSSSSIGSGTITSNESSSETLSECRYSKRISGEKRKSDGKIKAELECRPKQAAFICVECNKEFQRSQNHTIHMRKYHNQLQPVKERPKPKPKPKNNIELILSCEFCKKTLSSAKNLADHKAFHCIKSLDNIRKFCELQNMPTIGCSICGSTFETIESMQHHKTYDHIEFQMPIKSCAR